MNKKINNSYYSGDYIPYHISVYEKKKVIVYDANGRRLKRNDKIGFVKYEGRNKDEKTARKNCS